MNNATNPEIWLTHNGHFHCDDVFAYAALKMAFKGNDHILVRTRDKEKIANAKIVFDVGGIADEHSNRFDHHQQGAPRREDGTSYSSAGLIWKKYGERAVSADLAESCKEGTEMVTTIAKMIDERIVKMIDLIDNGEDQPSDKRYNSIGLAQIVNDFNPTWDMPPYGENNDYEDHCFKKAVDFVYEFLSNKINQYRAKILAENHVLAAYQNGIDDRILIMDRSMPWNSTAFKHGFNTLFAVYPAQKNGQWMVDTMPIEPGSYSQKKPLPAEWAGLVDNELATVSGIPDAVFVHLKRFCGAAKSKEGAIAMARKALATTD